MNLAYFGIDSGLLAEVVGGVLIFSLVIERLFSVIFEWRVLHSRIDNKGIKEPVVLVATFLIIYFYGFDALAILFQHDEASLVGYLLTTGIIAGVCKGWTRLFRDVLGWKSRAVD
ncbi:MAG: hypothetical protein QNI96_14210 [Woeseiaceae bacterium]|nr:hypothetical protein [Woeseiaceae bacterium]